MTENLGDFFAAEERRRLDEARAEIAAERAKWDAMTDAERAAATAAYEARFPDVDDEEGPRTCNDCGESADDCACDDD